ncbi:MAG: D-glycero-beta-D-manno-heptose 1,7-bisphosphate 7-phosphatase [Nanoarchaeota archaeon]|nr:D-glycero-beta-D-manno-heptose 1,7-bisphosphate 7-phosphatase [Nanoarchaeota archaeon]
MKKAVFLDRDGVINVDYGFVHTVEKFKFSPRAIDALKILADSDYLIIIITNQSGIGKGLYEMEDFEKVMDYMENELVGEGIVIDDTFYCPHSPEENCECRKPKPKMILDAAEKHNIDLSKSWMIGDKEADVQCGKNAGCKTIFVKIEKEKERSDGGADIIVKDLYEAVEKIIKK